MIPNLPELSVPLAAAFLGLATAFSAWLRTDKFPEWLNGLLTAIVVALCAFAWAVVSSAFTGSFLGDFLLLFVLMLTLLTVPGMPLNALQIWLDPKLLSPITAIITLVAASRQAAMPAQATWSRQAPTPPVQRASLAVPVAQSLPGMPNNTPGMREPASADTAPSMKTVPPMPQPDDGTGAQPPR